MKCLRCQQENPTAAKFCLECGMPFRAVATGSYVDLRAENEQLKRFLAEATEQQTATREILRVISSSSMDLQPVLDALVESAGGLCQAADTFLLLVDGDQLSVAALHGSVAEGARITNPIDRGWVAGRAVMASQIVHVEDLANAEAEFPLGAAIAAQFGHRTALALPLVSKGVPIGALFLRRREVRPFSGKEIALLQTFADQAVIAIENVRLFTELQASNHGLTESLKQQTATADILRVISSSMPIDLQSVFDTIVRSAVELCGAAFGGLHRLERDSITLDAQYGVPADELLVLQRDVFPLPLSRESVTGRAMLDLGVVQIADIRLDPNFRTPRLRAMQGYRTVLAVPMIREGIPIGALALWRREVHPFSDTEIGLVQTFADQAVIAIENVRLFKELAARNSDLTEALDRQTATADILQAISHAQTDVQPVFEVIADSTMRLLGAWATAVGRYDGEMFSMVAARGGLPGSADAAKERLQPPHRPTSPPERTVLTKMVHHVVDVQTDSSCDSEFRRHAAERGFRSFVAVPMLRGSDAVGMIAVSRPQSGGFSTGEIALLQTFADQAVIAVENVRLFNETKEALERQTATGEILRIISRSPTDIGPVLETIVEHAGRVCGAFDAIVFLVQGDELVRAAHLGPLPITEGSLSLPIARDSASGVAVLDCRTVHVEDILASQEFPRGRVIAERSGFRTAVSVPLMKDGVAIGTLVVRRSQVQAFTGEQVALLETFADQAVIAIENVRLFTELDARNRDLTTALEQQTATGDILRVISGTQTDEQPVFDTIVRSAVRLCSATSAAVFRIVSGMVYEPANYGLPPERLAATRARYPLPLDMDTPPGVAIVTRSVFQVADTEEPSMLPHVRETGRLLGIRSLVAVPMIREGDAVGAIIVTRREPGAFPTSQVDLLKTFADQAVIAIENARLFRELQARTEALARSVEQLTALSDVGRAVSSSLDLETVLTTIVSRAVELTGLDGGVVFEYGEDDQHFVQRAHAETASALAAARRRTRIRKGEGVVGRTAMTLEPVQVADITAAGAYVGPNRENLIEAGVRAILAVPMMREGHLIGCIGVTRNQPGEFPTETIELLRTFATQSALAIQNARLYHEIADKSRQLEVASQHKSEFLANMSHELRTPLNAVIGFSEVLSERMFGELNDKQDEYLKDIHASGQHLLSLINDILDLSKIEAGKMELELTDVHLPAAVDNALTLVRERAGRHSITLHAAIDDRLEYIRADERKIKQVLLNLLSNAIKFTPEGGRIDVKATPVDGYAEVSVSDTGVGIAPEDQDAIFEEFRQVGTAAKKVEGTGLGLALSRKFIGLHGGKIWVKSQVGAGSTFTFTIPLRHGE